MINLILNSAIRLLTKSFFYPYVLVFQSEERENKKVFDLHASGRILDLGCGSANYMPYCIQLPSVSQYIPVDYPIWAENFGDADLLAGKNGSLGKALFRSSPNKAVINVDGRNLPFERCTFDTVISLGVLEHVPNYELYLSEVQRVLKIGGKLIITIPFLYEAHGGENGSDDYIRWTKSGLIHDLTKCGLNCELVETYGGVGTMFSQLINSYLIKKINIYEKKGLNKKLLLLPFLAFIFLFVNLICWILDRIDRDPTYASGFRAVARKQVS